MLTFMLTFEDLLIAFASPRDDHPGRRGSQVPRRGSGHFPRFRARRFHFRESARGRDPVKLRRNVTRRAA